MNDLLENVRPLLPCYEGQLMENSFLFPEWSESISDSAKHWNVKSFFKRTLGLTTTSTNLRAMIEMTASRMHTEKIIDESTR